MAKPNGHAKRLTSSWIDTFIDYTSNLNSAEIFRRWTAISTISAVLEQKVWIMTSSPLYPNLYIFLVGHPGVGKTRTISAAAKLMLELPEPHLAPTSMTMASLTDCLLECKRTIINLPDPPMEYNSMYIMADELSAFLAKYDEEMIGGLTTFYDVNALPYGQHRRGRDIKIKIKNPQLNILSGTTPSNLIKFMPEYAWDQGFTSRIIMVFSDERPKTSVWKSTNRSMPPELVADLKFISTIVGQFKTTPDFEQATDNWMVLGEPPIPNHPRLLHYNTRRFAHMLKLSMVSSVDRGSSLSLDTEDFNRAMNWLTQAEELMPSIFQAGAPGADARAMDEIYHYIQVLGVKSGAPEHKVVDFARKMIPAHSVLRALEIMERSGMIKAQTVNARTGERRYFALGMDNKPEGMPS